MSAEVAVGFGEGVDKFDETSKWAYLDHILKIKAADNEEVDTSDAVADGLAKAKILVIGAGGLGCEMLKNLAMSGFQDIFVIDMDTIDVSNLNRQFLFRKDDVGKFKADIAAKKVMSRCKYAGKTVNITAYNQKIQDFDADFYMQFQVIICGLDSIEARRWINAMLVDMFDEENPDSLKPLVDGGTEGFKGQARVIFPSITACIECQLDLYAPRAAVPLCTLANIPRQPEHCIEWARIVAWDEEKPFPKLDTDDPQHITWLFEKALTRAKQYGIEGVTYSRTQGVVKNIVPAIASTNAIIAGACCNEAFKIVTSTMPFLGIEENYMQYQGDESIYTNTFKYEKREDCPVCGEGTVAKPLDIDPATWTLQDLVDSLQFNASAQLKKPSIRAEGKSLYMQFPPGLEEQTRPNLKKRLTTELGLEEGQELAITDPAFPTLTLRFLVRYKSGI